MFFPFFTAGKTNYNEKVDIYSLGIIFFEMCHPPLLTGMERIKVLSSLRLPEIVLPVSDNLTGKEVYYKLIFSIK
jgi:translation initiation factor 2-alpha kinase 4